MAPDETSLEAALERARTLEVSRLADRVQAIGFECTRCGACCRGEREDPHTATVYPDEVRELQTAAVGATEWRDVARPMPYGLDESGAGATLEWAIQTDQCGDCVFHDETGGQSRCTAHDARPMICQTYPFSLDLEGTAQPAGEPIDRTGQVVVHECEGLGQDMSRDEAESMARSLKQRAIRDLEEAIALLEEYEPVDVSPGTAVVHDSEGVKRPDGSRFEE
ncbi:MAG: YkgJ family cysteine cluster protein [Natrialbaceae archaeon]|nr:YkgJ family cysteine cluster protein [Natrialbaceae archaeon]